MNKIIILPSLKKKKKEKVYIYIIDLNILF